MTLNILDSVVVVALNEAELLKYAESDAIVEVASIELGAEDSINNQLGERVVRMGYIISPFFQVKIPYSIVEDDTTYKLLLVNKDESMVSVVAVVKDLFQYIEDYEAVLANLVGGLLLQNIYSHLTSIWNEEDDRQSDD